MTRWIPWNPTVAPTREECEALIGQQVRIRDNNRPDDWLTGVVCSVWKRGDRVDVVLVGPLYDMPVWLWPTHLDHAPFVVVGVEAP